MEEINDINEMLDLMIQPAFSVVNGVISHQNAASGNLLLDQGMAINDLLDTGAEEYASLEEGSLYLTLRIGSQVCGASVRRFANADVFVLDPDTHQAELQAMALAARELRQPLSNVMTVADRMFPIAGKDEDPVLQEQVARINRGLYQMLRIIGNLSDAYRYTSDNGAGQQTRNICALLEEIFAGHAALLQNLQIKLNYTIPHQPIYCLVDEEMIERAVSNIFSNAAKFSHPGDQIHAALVRKGDLLYLTVKDEGSGIAPSLLGNVYSRYLREPGIEDGRFGIGLGMVLIRSAATAHGGTVLIEQPKEGGTQITMTMQIRQNNEAMVFSPVRCIDYAGERDHKLIELSETLPISVYKKENIN